jgi:hypothetical protein
LPGFGSAAPKDAWPAQIDAARRALAAAVAVDEVKDILNMQVYAYQARDAQHMAWSAELHERAERKVGGGDGRAAGKMSKGTRGSPIKGARVPSGPTLADQGVDKNLANEA